MAKSEPEALGEDEIQRLLRSLPLALEPVFSDHNPGASIDLFEGRLLLRQEDEIWEIKEGKVSLDWLPSPAVRFRGIADRALNSLDFDGKVLEIPDRSETFDCQITRSQLIANSILEGKIGSELPPADRPCDRVVIAFCNTPEFLGGPIRDRERVQAWRGRIRLEWQDWILTIDELKDCRERRAVLKRERGYGIVALGAFEQSAGAEFSTIDATRFLGDLATFWSFVTGRWCGPILPVGFHGGLEVWRHLRLPRLRRWSDQRSCLNLMYADAWVDLQQLFQGFMQKHRDPLWSHPISFAIYWYVEANSDAGGAEGGLVLMQAALEMLSWVVLVEDPASLRCSPTQFKKLHAEGQLRELLRHLGIPTGIPQESVALKSLSDRHSLDDGIGAIVWVRNRLIHPKRQYRDDVKEVGGQAMVEASQLSLWFLELALLALMGYRGLYSDRFKTEWAGQRFRVPWATDL